MANKAFTAYCRAFQQTGKQAMRIFDWSEPELLRGPGAIKKLPDLIKSKGVGNVLVVTDKGLTGLGLHLGFVEALEAAGVKYALYDGTEPNPSIENIEEAYGVYVKNGCEAVVAFGGGSPMDCAKVVAAKAVCPKKTVPQMKGLLKIRKKLPLLFAIPTTAGTGSETTLAAVISNHATNEKFTILDPVIKPKVAVLDPELTIGLPPKITGATGMDALTHAVEAYIGGENTAQTRADALLAVELIYKYLVRAYDDGTDVEARDNMLYASYKAGLAFTRAYVGYVHAVAHNVGALYHVHHGLACAIALPHVLDRFGFADHKQLAELADAAGISEPWMSVDEKAVAFIRSVKELNSRLGIPAGFDMIKAEDVETIAQRADKEANPLYPVPVVLDKKELAELIRSMMI